MLASDLARRSDLPSWGGSSGLAYLITSFVPLLRGTGLDGEIDRFLVDNPRRFLAWD